MLGADIGTTIAAQVLSFDLGWVSPLLIGTGVIAFLSSEQDKARHSAASPSDSVSCCCR